MEFNDIAAPVPIAEIDIKGSMMLIKRNIKAAKATIATSLSFTRLLDNNFRPHLGQMQS